MKIIVMSRPLDDVEAALQDRIHHISYFNMFMVNTHGDVLKFTQSQFTSDGPLHQL